MSLMPRSSQTGTLLEEFPTSVVACCDCESGVRSTMVILQRKRGCGGFGGGVVNFKNLSDAPLDHW